MTGGVQRAFSYEERKKIEKLLASQISYQKIGELIGRSKNGVCTEVRRLGRDLYTAKEAQVIVDKIKLDKYEKLSELNKKKGNTFKFKQRIEHLEMQLEILHDCVKELMNR